MRFWSRSLILSAASGMLALALGQTTPAPKPAPWKRYCQTNAGFCFRYPGSWMMLGEVFDGNGVVIAPPQKEDRALWDGITLAMVAPPPEGDEEAAGLDAIVGQAAAGMRDAGENFVTLQRRQRTVAHNPAQMLKAQYREKSTGREWLEEVVFIEGPDNEIYSVALRCAPQNFARLEPTLNGVLASWRLPEPEAPAGADRNAPATAPAGGKPPADRFNP